MSFRHELKRPFLNIDFDRQKSLKSRGRSCNRARRRNALLLEAENFETIARIKYYYLIHVLQYISLLLQPLLLPHMGTTFFVEGVNNFFPCVHGSKMAIGEVMFLAAIAWVNRGEGGGENFLHKEKIFLVVK